MRIAERTRFRRSEASVVAGRRRSRPVRYRVLVLDCECLQWCEELREPYAPEFHPADEFHDAIRRAPASATVVVCPSVVQRCFGTEDGLASVVEAAGMAPVFASVALSSVSEGQLLRLADAGVTDVLDAGIEQSHEIASTLFSAARAMPLKRLLEQGLPRDLSGDALILIRAAAEVAVNGGGAEDLSEVFDARERTVSGWCTREGLPAPRRLLAWLRLILAVALLADPRRLVAHAASAAGYTDHSLRRALRTFLGEERATREWTVSHALYAFSAELSMLRERTRGRPGRGGMSD